MKSLLGVLILSTLVACTGGGGSGSGGVYTGGGSTGGSGSGGSGGSGGGSTLPDYSYYSHAEMAEIFVGELNLDLDFDVTLVKGDTLEADFLVIYDPYTDSYDALNIDSYNPNYDNAADYYYANSARNYFDLDVIPGHYETDYDYTIVGYDAWGDAIWDYEAYDVWVPTRYEDYATGVLFEKTSASSKDLAKMVALKEAAAIEKSAEFLSSNFGLSLDRGKELAGLQAHWKKASKKSMTNAEVDSFSTELLGFSLTQGLSAYKASVEGDNSGLDALIKQSAAVNGITPEHASGLMTKVFGL